MVVFALQLKLEMDGEIATVEPHPEKTWHVKLECGHCNEGTGKFTTITPGDEVDVPGGRGIANLVQKCKFCERDWNVTIAEHETTITKDNNEEFATVCTMDCRGCTVIEWAPMNEWCIMGPKAKFEDVDLSEDWCDYDEEAEESLSILSTEARVEVSSSKGGKHARKKNKKKK